MAISYLSAINFNQIPGQAFVLPSGTDEKAVPTPVEGQLFYKVTTDQFLYYNGSAWIVLGEAGSSGPPSGPAGGDLSGTYPNPEIKAGAILDSEINPMAGIAQSKISGLESDLAARARASTAIAAGAGLTGGGTLAANRSIDVGAGTGISVSADAVAVDQTWLGNFVATNAPPPDLTGYQTRAEKGAAGGYTPLDANGLVPTIHIPPLAINEVFTVASEAAMLALSAQRGDMAIRTDNGKTFVLSTDSPSVLASWKEVMATGQVVSVNGQTGIVTISLATLGAVSTTTQVIAGNGLTGGGSLSSSVTLNVVGDGNLSVAPDLISVLSAPKWTTPRTLSLTGDVTGTTTIDGSGNVAIATSTALAKHFAGPVAAGTAPVVTHGLGTRDVTVEVYRSAAPYDTVLCDVERTSTTTVTLRFATAVTAGQFRCVVTGR